MADNVHRVLKMLRTRDQGEQRQKCTLRGDPRCGPRLRDAGTAEELDSERLRPVKSRPWEDAEVSRETGQKRAAVRCLSVGVWLTSLSDVSSWFTHESQRPGFPLSEGRGPFRCVHAAFS